MNFYKTIFFLLLLAFSQVSFSQSPYQLGWKKEAAFFGGAGVVLGLGSYLSNQTPLLTPDELMTLNPKDINAFDRLATNFSSDNAHQMSNYFWYGSHALPLLFLTGKDTRSDFGKIAAMYGETALINLGLTIVLKSTFQRPRPFVFDPDVDLTRKQTVSARASFVSGHTSMTAANSFFVAKVFSDYYPDSKWKPVVWGIAATIPAVTGYLRVRAGRHYPTDVIGGYLVGAAVGYFVPQLHRKKGWKKGNIQSGVGLNSAYFVLTF